MPLIKTYLSTSKRDVVIQDQVIWMGSENSIDMKINDYFQSPEIINFCIFMFQFAIVHSEGQICCSTFLFKTNKIKIEK